MTVERNNFTEHNLILGSDPIGVLVAALIYCKASIIAQPPSMQKSLLLQWYYDLADSQKNGERQNGKSSIGRSLWTFFGEPHGQQIDFI